MNSHQTVLVNRGWVPEGWKSNYGPNDETPIVKVNGVVAESERPSTFVPKNEPSKGNWFSINTSEIVRMLQFLYVLFFQAQTCGLAADTLLVQTIRQSEDRNIAPQIRKPNGHFFDQTYPDGGRRSIEFNSNERYPVPKELSDFTTFTIMPSTSFSVLKKVLW